MFNLWPKCLTLWIRTLKPRSCLVLKKKDPILAEEIRKLMFVFEDIVKIDDKGIQTLLKEVPNDKLLLALKTANEEIRGKIFKNISQRAAKLLQDDLGNMGPARLSDVESAQVEIVNVARRLEQEGKILIARGGSEDCSRLMRERYAAGLSDY